MNILVRAWKHYRKKKAEEEEDMSDGVLAGYDDVGNSSHTGAMTISTGFPVPVNSAVEFQYSMYSF